MMLYRLERLLWIKREERGMYLSKFSCIGRSMSVLNFDFVTRIRKGQTIFIPILAINRATEIWGEDAGEFRLVSALYA